MMCCIMLFVGVGIGMIIVVCVRCCVGVLSRLVGLLSVMIMCVKCLVVVFELSVCCSFLCVWLMLCVSLLVMSNLVDNVIVMLCNCVGCDLLVR